MVPAARFAEWPVTPETAQGSCRLVITSEAWTGPVNPAAPVSVGELRMFCKEMSLFEVKGQHVSLCLVRPRACVFFDQEALHFFERDFCLHTWSTKFMLE